MAVRKDKRTGRWTVEFQLAGKRIFRRLPAVATKADAEELEARLRQQDLKHRVLGRKEELTLDGAIEAWLKATEPGRKDKRSPKQNWFHLKVLTEGKMLREVGDVAVAAIARWSRPADARRQPLTGVGAGKQDAPSDAPYLSAATINRRLDVLRAAARYAWKQGKIDENLSGRVPRLKEENARQVFLTPASINQLAKCAASDEARSIIMLAAYTGLRASELWALTASDLRKDSLMVRASKTGKPRVVPVGSPALPYLSALPLAGTYRDFMDEFWKARKAAKMPHVHFHDLRHSFASMLINKGVDLYTVGKLLGHSSPVTTQRYAHLADAQLKKAVGKLT